MLASTDRSRTGFESNKLTALAVLAGASWLLPACGPPAEAASAQQAHDHGAGDAHAEEDAHAHGELGITVFGEEVWAYVAHQPLDAQSRAEFLVHLTRRADGAPVTTGSVDFVLLNAGQVAHRLTADAPRRPGLFVPAGVLPPGSFQAAVQWRGEGVEEELPLGDLVVHADHAAADAAAADQAEHTDAEGQAAHGADELIEFSVEQQWQAGLLLAEVGRATLAETVPVLGEFEAPTYARSTVAAPWPGRLRPPASGALPALGDRVEAGQELARLAPTLSQTERAALLGARADRAAFVAELDLRAFDLNARVRELEGARDAAEAQSATAQQAVGRLVALREEGLGTAAELEDARERLMTANAALRSARGQLDAAEQSLAELAAIRRRAGEELASAQRLGAVAAEDGAGAPGEATLTAQLSGEIVAVEAVTGEQVDAGATVYRILNSATVWLTARVPESIASDPDALEQVRFRPVGAEAAATRTLAEAGGELAHVSPEVDPDSRTVAVRYALPNPDGAWRIGMSAEVRVPVGVAEDAIVLPEEAVVLDNGRPVAFVLHDGEHFEKRFLELGVRDGGRVEIRRGVEAGERVATRGAFLIRLAAAQPESFGHGHAH